MVSSWIRTARAIEGYTGGDPEWNNIFQYQVDPDDPMVWGIENGIRGVELSESEDPEAITLVVETIRSFRENEYKQALADRRGYAYDKQPLPIHPFLIRILTLYDYATRAAQQPDNDTGREYKASLSNYIGNIAYSWDMARGLKWMSSSGLKPQSLERLRSSRKKRKSLELL